MGKVKYLQYILYGTVCIVSLMIALICIWWFLEKPYTKEDFIVAAPYVVMVGITSTGGVYYADIDVPMSPKWINTGLTGVGDIAGSYGRLYTIPTGGGSVKYGPYATSTGLITVPGVALKGVSVDDSGAMAGYTAVASGVSYAYAASSTASLTGNSDGKVKSVALSGGASYAVDNTASGALWYLSDSSNTNWVQTSSGGGYMQVSFDGAVCALKTDGTLWCADTNVGTANANWKQQGTQKFSQISLKGGRIVGVGFGTDTATYYSNTYANPTWTTVPTQEYNVTGATVGGALTFKKVIMFYPALDARRKRFVVTGTPCGTDEQQIGNFCYAPCASGRAAIGTKCPYRRKQTPAIPTCTTGDYINGSCYQACPDNNTTAQGELCVGNTKIKNVTGKLASVPSSYSCGDGTIGARYIRIRPTSIPSVNNNKLCISKLVVKDKDGIILSVLNGKPGVTSTIGSMSGPAIMSGISSIPILLANTINIPGADSSTVPLTIYIAEESGYTKMIANDAAGTAKNFYGPASAWTAAYWSNGVSAGTRASKQYILNLNKNPVKASATDGTCADTPIGGASCPGIWSTYVSSAKYDGEADGGRRSRLAKTYWELDLGAIQQIRTIEFTGCNYVPASGAINAAIDPAGLSQPNADQITGMKIELLESANLLTTEPIVDRTLGPQISQVLTFNFLTKEPGIDDTCYDACPKINGVQSVDGGQQTCIAASGGVTSRSVTTPLKLAPPVCSLPVNADGTPYQMPAEKLDHTQWNIGNWKINPSNPLQVLSCDVLPGSTLMPITNNSFSIPVIPGNPITNITYNLQDKNNTVYTPGDPGVSYSADDSAPNYKCVILDDRACTQYNVGGAVYKYRGGLCVRMDVSPDFQMNDDWYDSGNGTMSLGVLKDACGPGLRDDGTSCWEDLVTTTSMDPCPSGSHDVAGTCWTDRFPFYVTLALIDRHMTTRTTGCGCIKTRLWERNVRGVTCENGKSNNYSQTGGLLCWNNCPAGYSHYTGGGDATYQWCLNNKSDPTWGRRWWEGNYIYRYGLRGAKTLYDLMNGKQVVSNPPNSSVASPDDFKIPLITNDKSIIVTPQTFKAQCKCLNPDGTVNKEAYFYNGTCIKCANPNELFYAKGAISSDFAWGEEQKNKFLSIYDDRVTRPIDQKPFTSLNDAKTMCETDSFCTGITRSYDKNGTAYYYQRAGSTLKGTLPSSSGSSGSVVSSATADTSSSATASTPTWDSSWVKGTQGSDKVIVGLRKGTTYSTEDIPTAFADDYLSPTSRGSSVFSIIPATVTTLVNSMTNDILQAASAWASFQNSVQNPNTYYSLVGVERQLSATSKPSDNGICVAPCDPKHSLHDAVQMIKDPVANLYVLYGTTCHDATQTVVSKPNIPAVYTPQVGADCRAGYDLNNGGSCVEECSSSSLDNGSSCSENSVRRPSIAPVLSCGSGLQLIGGVCVHPCESGYTGDGDFCEPILNTVNLPSDINCVKTPYNYSSKYQGSTSSVNKWLCESDYDQYVLLQGPTGSSIVAGTSTYVNKNDIVCYADDSSTGMYYCQTVADAINEVDDTGRTDYSATCDTMTKAYFDLSNNLTTLMSAQTTAQNSSIQVAAIQTTLESIIQRMCGSGSGSGSGSSSPTCSSLRTQLAALNSNINSGSGNLSGVLTPIGVATASRDKLITLLRDIKCCPPGQTDYPWC